MGVQNLQPDSEPQSLSRELRCETPCRESICGGHGTGWALPWKMEGL